jgi:hypothetical protein
MPCRHQFWIWPWLTLAPSRLKPKKGPEGMSRKNCARLAIRAARKPSKTSSGMPSGLDAGLDHHRRHGADQHGLGDAAGLGPGGIARNLAAAGRMADVDGVLQVERRASSITSWA